jgi:hypothetical protein
MPEDNNKKLNVIHTPCKECVFAEYQDNTQTGCAAGMLDKFKSAGYDIVEVYDNDKEFFVINNKKCLFMRPQNWLIKNKTNNINEALEIATKENQIKYILILDINDSTTLDSINTTLTFFNEQKIVPAGILVMTDKKYKLQVDIKNIAKLLDSTKIKWRIQKFIDEDLSFSQKIKAIIQSAPMNRFYLYLDPIKFNTAGLDIGFLNTKILDGLVFGCVNMGGGLFFSYLSWQYAKLNKDIDIILDKTLHIPYEDIK